MSLQKIKPPVRLADPRNLGGRYALGLDFGTSGARAIAINTAGQIVAEAHQSFSETVVGHADLWQNSLWSLLESLPLGVRNHLGAITIDGTSGTVLLCDNRGKPVTEPLLYNDDRGRSIDLHSVAPLESPAQSATSSLAKVLWWWQTLPQDQLSGVAYLLHQADWLGYLLHGQLGVSDYHNALKLGYDVGKLAYPSWLTCLPMATWFPHVKTPGATVGEIGAAIATRFEIPPDCLVKAGTTDSIAAFLASGAATPGEAVTSLGSTLVLKLLSRVRIDDPTAGIYSHRLGDLWLVGGASNTGGAVLRQFFTDEQLQSLSLQINPGVSTGLNYYPLSCPGERFPINDPDYPPRLSPCPQDPVIFLQGLLEGIAQIEAQGYQRLAQLGATPATQVYTAGGGAQNLGWQAIRARLLNLPVRSTDAAEAAYGAARLAQGVGVD
ncbi:MAG: FGGY-family carbohydrate kinase [Cyanobacteria bacterium P01_G01_bin.38]